MPVIAIFTLHLLYHSAVWFAWSAGAAFVVSLLYLGYFYLHTLGGTAAASTDRLGPAVMNVLLFSVFAMHHSLLARPAIKRRVTRLIPPHLERAMYVWTASLLALALCVLWQPVPGLVYRLDGWLRTPFYLTQIAGFVLTVRAARAMSALELAGVRQASGRADAADLKIVGPFRVIRHPTYLGWMLMVFGSPTMTVDRLLFAGMSSVYLILAIPWEEKSLVADHGDRYREYQRSVRWRLVPRVW